MMALLMGVRDRDMLARACDLGVAMQLTNIARDVGEDARAGRLYLPTQWLEEQGLDPDDFLARPEFDERIASCVQRLLDTAEDLYARSGEGIERLPIGCRPAMYAARAIYREIGRELEELWPDRRVEPLLADVGDGERMGSILRRHRPQIVLHAAAHKHVPLMEANATEAIRNNVLTTHRFGELAGEHGVERFVLISTDKAVRPTSIMGASKRLAELVVQDLDLVPSSWRAEQDCESWLADRGLAVGWGFDTRAIVRHIREAGAVPGLLVTDGTEPGGEQWPALQPAQAYV